MTHSAIVTLRFIANGTTYDVAQTGPDFFILRGPLTLAAGVGQLVITVDGRKRVSQIVFDSIEGRDVRYQQERNQ
jgi:hypothetical protein